MNRIGMVSIAWLAPPVLYNPVPMEIPLPVPPALTSETLRPAIAGCAKARAWRVEPAGAGWRIHFGAAAAFRPEELPFVLDIAPAENGCAARATFRCLPWMRRSIARSVRLRAEGALARLAATTAEPSPAAVADRTDSPGAHDPSAAAAPAVGPAAAPPDRTGTPPAPDPASHPPARRAGFPLRSFSVFLSLVLSTCAGIAVFWAYGLALIDATPQQPPEYFGVPRLSELPFSVRFWSAWFVAFSMGYPLGFLIGLLCCAAEYLRAVAASLLPLLGVLAAWVAWMTFVPGLRLWALATAAVLPLACWAAYSLPWALRQEVDP